MNMHLMLFLTGFIRNRSSLKLIMLSSSLWCSWLFDDKWTFVSTLFLLFPWKFHHWTSSSGFMPSYQSVKVDQFRIQLKTLSAVISWRSQIIQIVFWITQLRWLKLFSNWIWWFTLNIKFLNQSWNGWMGNVDSRKSLLPQLLNFVFVGLIWIQVLSQRSWIMAYC